MAALTLEASPAWEKVAPVAGVETIDSSGSDTFEMKVVDRTIIIALPRKTSVKIFTILGQLVAERQLEAGVWRLPLSARGIYILKVGDTTRRITI